VSGAKRALFSGLVLVTVLFLGAALGVTLTAGRSADSGAFEQSALRIMAKAEAPAAPAATLSMEEERAAPRKEMKKRGMARAKDAPSGGGSGGFGDLETGAVLGNLAVDAAPEPDEAQGGEAGSAPARSWFPETFLFAPRLVTDAQGLASLEVKVPDRLTRWRVLALAHSRQGAQAGAVTSLQGTLPLYVDPLVPAFLHAGDQVELPVQVVNTTDAALRAEVEVRVEGARKVRGGGALTVPAARSVVQPAALVAERPGTLVLNVAVAGRDAVERKVQILPTGRPWSAERSGTLAAPRSVRLPAVADPEPGSTKLRLEVFPGALALVSAELTLAPGRRGVAEDAYALLVAGQGPGLLAKLGGEVDPRALRALTLTAAQRVIQHGRSPDTAQAALLAEAALAHPDNPVLQRLGERLGLLLARGQRPDGTFGGGSGWALPRLLAATAEGVAAVRAVARDEAGKQRAQVAALRASGAFERYAGRIDDPYTAAWGLYSQAAQGSLRETLAALVKGALVRTEDGALTLPVPPRAQRPDGGRPTEAEATALAVLALADDPEAAALLPDLGARLLGGYRPGWGWGDGRANLLALRAVVQVFSAPMPEQVQVTLRSGDTVLTQGTLAGAARREVMTRTVWLEALPADLQVVAEPPVPGLGYHLVAEANVPWDDTATTPGLELRVDVGRDARVGQPVAVTLTAGVPAGQPFEVRHALPAGVSPDAQSLSALVTAGKVTRFETQDGRVTLWAPPTRSGQAFSVSYRVVPSLAGRLIAGASQVALTNRDAVTWVPPSGWVVK
jgi:hypothetical protein